MKLPEPTSNIYKKFIKSKFYTWAVLFLLFLTGIVIMLTRLDQIKNWIFPDSTEEEIEAEYDTVFHGLVYELSDNSERIPIKNALVLVDGNKIERNTDSEGRFEFRKKSKSATIGVKVEIRKDGFQTMETSRDIHFDNTDIGTFEVKREIERNTPKPKFEPEPQPPVVIKKAISRVIAIGRLVDENDNLITDATISSIYSDSTESGDDGIFKIKSKWTDEKLGRKITITYSLKDGMSKPYHLFVDSTRVQLVKVSRNSQVQ